MRLESFETGKLQQISNIGTRKPILLGSRHLHPKPLSQCDKRLPKMVVSCHQKARKPAGTPPCLGKRPRIRRTDFVAARFPQSQRRCQHPCPYLAGQRPKDCPCRSELRAPFFAAPPKNEEAGLAVRNSIRYDLSSLRAEQQFWLNDLACVCAFARGLLVPTSHCSVRTRL